MLFDSWCIVLWTFKSVDIFIVSFNSAAYIDHTRTFIMDIIHTYWDSTDAFKPNWSKFNSIPY